MSRPEEWSGAIPTEAANRKRRPERALLAAGLEKKDQRLELGDPLGELAALADTAGVEVIEERVIQRRDRPDPATCVGKGTVERIAELTRQHDVDVVIFDQDLAPRQRRNLEQAINKKVIDRTELILDIFALHAKTPQARMQVELAQLEYALPRLRRMWTHLDTGVGFRAAGEKQIEVDKRLIKKRIQDLKEELGRVRGRRERQVQARGERYTVALVGYTNAGKSTLMNRLTEAGVYVADQLFATLDTRTRAWSVGPRREVLLSDTVGFIRHLPHHLVESFHATLEEVVTADLLLHVVDASDPEALEHVRAVREVLASLGLRERLEMILLNKIDRAEPALVPWLERRLANTLRVSALTAEGLGELAQRVNELAAREEARYALTVDVRDGAAVAHLEGHTEVLEKVLEEDGLRLRYQVRCRPAVMGEVRGKVRQVETWDQMELEAPLGPPPRPVAPPLDEEPRPSPQLALPSS